MTNLKEPLESRKYIQNLVFYSFFMGLLFPLRIFLNYILGSNWIGSFGVLTVISILFLFLAEKNKLGWYGRAFLNKFKKIQSSRKKYIVIGQAILGIILSITILYLISYGNTLDTEFATNTRTAIESNYESFDDFKQEALKTAKEKPLEVILGIFAIILLTFTNPDIVATILSIEDNMSGNLFTHLFTITLLEEIEILGIVIYYSKRSKNIKNM